MRILDFMVPIAIFFHGLFALGEPPAIRPRAVCVIANQIDQMVESGLWESAKEIYFGINGGEESRALAKSIIPEKAKVIFHGLQSRSENLTILMLEEWVKTHPGWCVLYCHAKGATHAGDSMETKYGQRWREGMMQDMVMEWRKCVGDLQRGYDIVTSNWLWGMVGGTQHIPAGNILWITSDFAAKLPSILLRTRIQVSGLSSLESRYEAEVYWGNGPVPKVKSCRPVQYWWRMDWR